MTCCFMNIRGLKPHRFRWLGDIHGPRYGDIHGHEPPKFIWFVGIRGPKPYRVIWFGNILGPEPYKVRPISALDV